MEPWITEEGIRHSVDDVELLGEGGLSGVDGEAFFVPPGAVFSSFAFVSDDGPDSEAEGSVFPFPA